MYETPWQAVTPAGRMAVANWLLEEGKITDPKDYLAILNRGRLAPYRMSEPTPASENMYEMGPGPTPAEPPKPATSAARVAAIGGPVSAFKPGERVRWRGLAYDVVAQNSWGSCTVRAPGADEYQVLNVWASELERATEG